MEFMDNIIGYYSNARRHQRTIESEEHILAINAWHLARYAIENNEKLKKEPKINFGEFICMCEKYPDLDDKDPKKIDFVNQYRLLEIATWPVTARTLVATRIHGRGFFHAAFGTSVGKYLLFLSFVSLMCIAALLVISSTNNALDCLKHQYWFLFNNSLLPFYAAGLGTCVYLLRVTQENLRWRTFDPALIPSHLIRLGLGILAGGTLVLFPDLLQNEVGSANSGSGENGSPRFGQGALAFIFGYAVDVFYAVLDKVGGQVKKQTEKNESMKQ